MRLNGASKLFEGRNQRAEGGQLGVVEFKFYNGAVAASRPWPEHGRRHERHQAMDMKR